MTLNLRDAARALKVDETVVYDWIRTRRLPTCGREGAVLVSESALREWALETGTPLDVGAFPAAGGKPAPGPHPLADAVALGGVLSDVPGNDRIQVLREVLARVPLPEGEDRAFVTEMVLAREALASTGVGNGIAIPHARTPVVVRLDRPLVTVAYPRRPVAFDAPDGIPVHALFTLLSPSASLHLEMLGHLARALRFQPLLDLLRARAPLADLLESLRASEARA